MSRRVLVTGGAGFIGSHIAEAYLRRDGRSAALDDLSRGKRRNVPCGVRLVRADIGRPRRGALVATGASTY